MQVLALAERSPSQFVIGVIERHANNLARPVPRKPGPSAVVAIHVSFPKDLSLEGLATSPDRSALARRAAPSKAPEPDRLSRAGLSTEGFSPEAGRFYAADRLTGGDVEV